jgi:hypothetical protein
MPDISTLTLKDWADADVVYSPQDGDPKLSVWNREQASPLDVPMANREVTIAFKDATNGRTTRKTTARINHPNVIVDGTSGAYSLTGTNRSVVDVIFSQDATLADRQQMLAELKALVTSAEFESYVEDGKPYF